MEAPGSLSSCMASARARGYQEVFRILNSKLINADGTASYEPTGIIIEDFQPVTNRLDPEKRSMLYLIETSDKRKGMVIDHHHTTPSDRFSSFISGK